MDQSIVVGLDGSAESVSAAHWAAREALLRNQSLLLVHAEEWLSHAGPAAAGAQARRQWAEALLLDAANVLREAHPQLHFSTRSINGPPAASLAEVAPTAEMLVLGSRGLGTLSGYILGSVGLAAIRATERPVVLVRQAEKAKLAPQGHQASLPVVVGIDRPHDALLSFAFDEAAQRGCLLRIIHSWAPPPLFGSGTAYDPEVAEQVTSRVAAKLGDVLVPWRDRYPAVPVEVRAAIGRPADQILQAGTDAGLVVVGRHIRTASIGTYIGPVTHAVLHHATPPVAVIAHHAGPGQRLSE
ncbi:universal stress protein [Streptomyces sp. NPDC014623]|uniref:universal stress protein n=1 Tax=Streptomyces sp. NPDC014623 TaxID=3364875 RepID=UPI0036FD0F48